MVSGIYIIHGPNKKYIGQAKDFDTRWSHHKQRLKTKTHPNRHLQSAWNKYGEDAFRFSPIEICPLDVTILDAREQYWLDTLKPLGLYNVMVLARSSLGVKRSDETKIKIGLASKGRKHSEETKRKYSTDRLGTTRSEETKQKMSVINKLAREKSIHKIRNTKPVILSNGQSFESQKALGVACKFANPAAAIHNALIRGETYDQIAKRRGVI